MAHMLDTDTPGWFAPGINKAMSPSELVEKQMMSEFLMDNAVGSTAAVRRHLKVRTPVKVSRSEMQDYCADMDRQYVLRKVAAVRTRNLRSA